MIKKILIPFILLTAALIPSCGNVSKVPVAESGEYRNLFTEMDIASEEEVNRRIEQAVSQLFYGDDNQKIYYEFGDDMAYILDVANNDVRSEGISYGMMFCVQLDMQPEFNRLWKYAHDIMLIKEGDRAGYFSWQFTPEGEMIDENPAPDGEEYMAMALLMASNRWGDGPGIFNYREQANTILDHMVRHQELVGLPPGSLAATNMIHPREKQIVFVPFGNTSMHTDPSYHLPHFYELFALWADDRSDLWREVAAESRILFQKACHPETGLAADYTFFDGVPVETGNHYRFENDASRVAMNIALDSYWWNKDPWQRKEWVDTYLEFFYGQGLYTYPKYYDIDGGNPAGNHSTNLVSMNAVAALISDDRIAEEFVREFWETPVPEGRERYFNGCLYLFALLNLSGNYRIIGPQG
jgi:endo-1,4-beta-D-glucanase Y